MALAALLTKAGVVLPPYTGDYLKLISDDKVQFIATCFEHPDPGGVSRRSLRNFILQNQHHYCRCQQSEEADSDDEKTGKCSSCHLKVNDTNLHGKDGKLSLSDNLHLLIHSNSEQLNQWGCDLRNYDLKLPDELEELHKKQVVMNLKVSIDAEFKYRNDSDDEKKHASVMLFDQRKLDTSSIIHDVVPFLVNLKISNDQKEDDIKDQDVSKYHDYEVDSGHGEEELLSSFPVKKLYVWGKDAVGDQKWKTRASQTDLQFYIRSDGSNKVRLVCREPGTSKLRLNHYIPSPDIAKIKNNSGTSCVWMACDSTIEDDDSGDQYTMFCAKFADAKS